MQEVLVQIDSEVIARKSRLVVEYEGSVKKDVCILPTGMTHVAVVRVDAGNIFSVRNPDIRITIRPVESEVE